MLLFWKWQAVLEGSCKICWQDCHAQQWFHWINSVAWDNCIIQTNWTFVSILITCLPRRENKVVKLLLFFVFSITFSLRKMNVTRVFSHSNLHTALGRLYVGLVANGDSLILCFIRSYNHREIWPQNKFVDPGRDDERQEVAVWCGCYWWQTLCNWRSRWLKDIEHCWMLQSQNQDLDCLTTNVNT